MLKKTKKLVSAIILVLIVIGTLLACVLMAGCAIEGDAMREGPWFARGSTGVEAGAYQVTTIGDKISTVPTHKNDWYLVGDTETDIEGEFGPHLAPFAGILGGYQITDQWYIGAGVRGRANMACLLDGERNDGAYDSTKHDYDDRTSSNGAFAYTQVVPGPVTIIPMIETGYAFDKEWFARLGAGLPYQEWKVSSGWDRHGNWEEYQDDTWTGFGSRIELTVGKGVSDLFWSFEDYIFISAFWEHYDPDFLGQGATIEVYGLTIGWMGSW